MNHQGTLPASLTISPHLTQKGLGDEPVVPEVQKKWGWSPPTVSVATIKLLTQSQRFNKVTDQVSHLAWVKQSSWAVRKREQQEKEADDKKQEEEAKASKLAEKSRAKSLKFKI